MYYKSPPKCNGNQLHGYTVHLIHVPYQFMISIDVVERFGSRNPVRTPIYSGEATYLYRSIRINLSLNFADTMLLDSDLEPIDDHRRPQRLPKGGANATKGAKGGGANPTKGAKRGGALSILLS